METTRRHDGRAARRTDGPGVQRPAPPSEFPFPVSRLTTIALATAAAFLAACSHQPPPDFAPDPGLVDEISEIRAYTPEAVCPGRTIEAEYEAVLQDGRRLPFSTDYDEDHPPPLHVVFLRLDSPEATPQEDGDWGTVPDPLVSAMAGFRLHAELRAKPSIATDVVVVPDYACQPTAFRFEGRRGERGRAGYGGPDVVVRLNVLSSPFYEQLLVAGIEVENAPPFYVLHDASTIPPSDFLIIESRGGRGGRGPSGEDGAAGQDGQAGCPGAPGGTGGTGGNGGPGGPGGPGGHVTVIAPSEQPFLAGLVETRNPGGPGGSGGAAGRGGAGGEGGEGTMVDGRRCANGAGGAAGSDGRAGPDGPSGAPGPRSQVLTVPAEELFGPRAPIAVRSLVDYSRN